MDQLPTLTDDVFAAFLRCRYKAYLKLRGAQGEGSDYGRTLAGLSAVYRAAARQDLLRRHEGEAVVESPPSLPEAIRAGPALIVDATVGDAGESCRLDALERVGGGGTAPAAAYRPVLFVRPEKVTAEDKLLLAFGASILARVQGTPSAVGKIVHGKGFRHSRVELATLTGEVRDAVAQARALVAAPKPPPLVLNKHCPECEFRKQCRAAALEKDDLSLLAGLSPKEVSKLNGRGVFTVTQYSYTFRPGRMKKAAEEEGRKHDHSLQALAVRESTVYVARRPELPDAKARLYLDVEGLPDEDWYYLIGLTISEGGSQRRLYFWADGEAGEASVWASFLEVLKEFGDDFVLFHYGSYESKFLDKMGARHGGDPGLVARVRARSVNVLSLIYAPVYFPVHSNDLKSVAGCLGFRWSAPDASGLQAVAWRYGWEANGDEALKGQLLAYNREDCAALERVVEMLRSLGHGDTPHAQGGGPRVTDVERAAGPYRHRLGTPRYATPELARITRCAYFDYQRDKVVCRTSPRAKRVLPRQRGPKRRAWKVNQEVECGPPLLCPQCGSAGFDPQSRHQKVVADLRPSRTGVKRWVTRYRAKRYRCRECLGTFLPEDYLAISSKYGWGVYSRFAYATVSLRLTNDALVEDLSDLFGITLPHGSLNKLRRRVVDHYRPTYDSLLSALRNGPLAHADETKVKIKGRVASGYVWVFASPTTVVYVYAPTRDGDTARETLAGFKGVLVSDFYAAYDSLDCPQQKCLIHLVRDFNDDLLGHPFDGELKQQAARFTALLQPIVETIDRYGLKKYHLHKHQKDVERFYDAESGASYGSELARHYQHRLLKYRGKLFTFLDYDGVPWNNNNGEHAVKAFASRRKAMGRAFAEDGIKDYLLLLSIYQTLRYRNLSFWQFLLSGETDIEAYTARRR